MAQKLFNNLLKEVTENHRGWYGVKKPHWIFVILSGQYTGEWSFAKGRVNWKPMLSLTPAITQPHEHSKMYTRYVSLVAKNKARYDEALAWTQEFIPQSLWMTLQKRYDYKIGDYVEEMAELKNYGRESQCIELQVLAGIVGQEKVIEGLKLHPKRWEAMTEFKAPTTMAERIKYCKAFAEHWSHNKAMKATYPGVHPANLKHVRSPTSIVTFALNGVKTVFTQTQVEEILGTCGMFKHEYPKLRTKQFRSLLPAMAKMDRKTWDAPANRYIDHIKDTLRMANAVKELCTQHDVPIPAHTSQVFTIMSKDEVSWSNLHKLHNHVSAEERVIRAEYKEKMDAQQRENVRLHQEKALEYDLFEGITPIVTVDDFTKEGSEMHHCIAGYWKDCQSHFFAFKLGEERASLQLNLSPKRVVQFYGPYNKQVSTEMKELLNKFLKANKFPLVEVDKSLGYVINVLPGVQPVDYNIGFGPIM